MRGLKERIEAFVWVATVLIRTERRRKQAVAVAIVGENGRMAVRRSGGWDAYEWPEDFEE